MAEVRIEVDAAEAEKLGGKFEELQELSVRRLTERGEQLVRQHAPKQTGNLKQGVSHDFEAGPSGLLQGLVTVSARSGRTGGGTGTLHLSSGKTRPVRLRPQAAFNYAEVVARGRPALRPRNGRALLIPVPGPPSKGGYITLGGKTFVVRRSAAAVDPNPYDERAGRDLEGEAPTIVAGAARILFAE